MVENRSSNGFNIIVLTVTGKDIDKLHNEAGGHRIQRVPPTEKRGRVHTSTVTVAVTGEVTNPDSDPYSKRSKDDFRVEYFSGSGAGGQHRNKHANCARVIHLPSGLKQECQGRKRGSNYREAMASLQAMLDERMRSETKAVEDDVRRTQIGSGMRGDKRRTYRFQDDVVVDHLTGKSTKASKVMKGAVAHLWR